MKQKSQQEIVREFSSQGLSLRQIQKLTGIPKTTVHRLLKGESRSKIPTQTKESAEDLRKSSVSLFVNLRSDNKSPDPETTLSSTCISTIERQDSNNRVSESHTHPNPEPQHDGIFFLPVPEFQRTDVVKETQTSHGDNTPRTEFTDSISSTDLDIQKWIDNLIEDVDGT